MLVLIYICTILWGYLTSQKKNKYYWIWCSLLLALIVNTTDEYADFLNYDSYFIKVGGYNYSIEYDGMPFGWYYLCRLFYNLGFSYRGMVIIIIFISCYLLHKFITYFDCKENFFWASFLIFPALIQCVQLRFFLGTSIVMFFLKYLLTDKTNWLMYIAGTILASTIHASCMIFLIFLVLRIFKNITIKKSLIYCLSAFIVILLSINLLPIIIKPLIPSVKFERYFTNSISKTSMSWFIQICFVWIMMCCYAIWFRSNINYHLCDKKNLEYLANKLYMIPFLLIVVLPFMKFDRNFHRFLEVGYYCVFILYCLYTKYRKGDKFNYFCIMGLLIISLILCAYIYYPYDAVIKPLLSFNQFNSIFLQ